MQRRKRRTPKPDAAGREAGQAVAPLNPLKRVAFARIAFDWLLVGLWMAVIYAMSDVPHSGDLTQPLFGPANFSARKFAHFAEFAVLFWLSLRAVSAVVDRAKGVARLSQLPVLCALFLSVAYAFMDEWHQSFVPGRSATAGDVAFDASGALAGLCLALVRRRNGAAADTRRPRKVRA